MRPQKEARLHWAGAGMRRLLLILDNNKHKRARGGHNEEELHEKLRKLSIKLSEKGQQQQQNQQQPSESTEKMNNLLIFFASFLVFSEICFFSPSSRIGLYEGAQEGKEEGSSMSHSIFNRWAFMYRIITAKFNCKLTDRPPFIVCWMILFWTSAIGNLQ